MRKHIPGHDLRLNYTTWTIMVIFYPVSHFFSLLFEHSLGKPGEEFMTQHVGGILWMSIYVMWFLEVNCY